VQSCEGCFWRGSFRGVVDQEELRRSEIEHVGNDIGWKNLALREKPFWYRFRRVTRLLNLPMANNANSPAPHTITIRKTKTVPIRKRVPAFPVLRNREIVRTGNGFQ
jgi:hypothetical protein